MRVHRRTRRNKVTKSIGGGFGSWDHDTLYDFERPHRSKRPQLAQASGLVMKTSGSVNIGRSWVSYESGRGASE